MIEKHRGIRTNTSRKNEQVPKTIINRLGQKSMSLPRIDDGKRFAGFAGLAGVASKIASMIPTAVVYVEPFAGSAKVYQMYSKLKSYDSFSILNDRAKFVRTWLKREFDSEFNMIESLDFIKCIKKWDSTITFFLIDPPWFKSFYDQPFSYFDRDTVKEYDEQLIDLCKKIKGKFIITTRKENRVMLRSGFDNHLVRSVYVVSGKYPDVMITTNMKIRKGRQNIQKMNYNGL